MPRRPDVPCSMCGGLMWRGTGSLPQGTATCQPCRRTSHSYKARQAAKRGNVRTIRQCPRCSQAFMQRRSSQRYCSQECRIVVQRTNWKPGPSNPKYKSPEHRRERAKWVTLMAQHGYLECSQPTCLMPTRTIHEGDRWHLGHDDDGVAYIGPTHERCNVVDGAKRGNRRSRQPLTSQRWAL